MAGADQSPSNAGHQQPLPASDVQEVSDLLRIDGFKSGWHSQAQEE
jgi:hypothetical protein